MKKRDRPATSSAHLQAIDRAMSDDSLAAPVSQTVQIRNFAFSSALLPGWNFARARVIDTGRGIRLVQVNAQAEGTDSMARIEIHETAGAEEARAFFRETLTRFQHDPAPFIRNPPEIGEAEARFGDGAIVFLRGNLVVTITSIAATGLGVQQLARQIDDWVVEKPTDVQESAGDSGAVAGKPMIKTFTRVQGQGNGASESFEVATDGSARRLGPAGGGD